MLPMTDTPDIPEGQPTWARIRHGAGCALPRRLPDGTIGMLPVAVPMRLQPTHMLDDQGRAVWLVPDRDWASGDHVEIGPLPADVVVHYDIHRPFVAPMPARVDAADDGQVA